MKSLYAFSKKVTQLCLLALLTLIGLPNAQAQFTQLQKLTPRATQRQAGAEFGTSIAMDGNLMVVGAPGDRNGGAVYVYERSGETWSQINRLIPSDGAPEDDFGCSVSVSGNTIVVGNNREYDANSSNPVFEAGAAYIFEKQDGTWQQTQKLTAPIRNAFDNFGNSVSVSGNTLVVGVPGVDYIVSNNPRVNNAGAVYVYEKSEGSWQLTEQLREDYFAAGDEFGYSVSLSGSTLVVGAINEGDDPNGSSPVLRTGSAYVFEKSEGTWSQTGKLSADDRAEGDFFGYSVSLSGSTIVVGARDEGNDPNGNNPVSSAGAAYVFEKSEGTWTQTGKLTASDRDSYDEFGGSVSVSGSTIVVGARENKENTSGPLDGVGSAYLFEKSGTAWQQTQKLTASDYAFGDFFGYSVCVSGSTIVVGATQEDEDASGSNSLDNAGSAYVFGIPCLAPTAFALTGGGSYCAGGSGVILTLSGSETGVSYQLKNSNNPVGATVPGTGTALSFGPLTTAGTYTVVASRSASCMATMTGSATVTVNTLPAVSISGLASSFCKNAAAVPLTGNPAGGSFTIDGNPATSFDPASLAVGNRVVVYTFTDPTTTCTNTASQTVTVKALPVVSITGLANSFCKNESAVTLTGSPAGGSFTIDGNAATTFDPASLAVGNRVVVYTFTDPTTTCTNSASQTVTVGQPQFSSPASVSGGPGCAGSSLTLSFGVSCPTNASFMAELTDAAGMPLGIALGTVSPGNQSVTIPAGTPTGSYKIRVTGSNPTITSLSNAFGVTGLSANFNSTATVSQVPACAGASIRVSFTQAATPACSFPLGNGFTTQLSDATGSFASPVTLGSVSPGINSVTIPQNTPTGSGYRVRIAATAGPEYSGVYSAPSAAFTVNGPAFASTPTVSADNKCAGEAVRVSFSVNSCPFPSGNVFRVQLSNASGSFETPLTLPGTVTPGGLNNVTIPTGTPAGTGYKLRLVSSTPEAMSAASGTFKVKACGNPREAAPEERGLRVVVSPNPAPEGRLRIAVSGAEGQTLKVELFNGLGQSLRAQTIRQAREDETLDWDITRQPAGLYLLRVSGEREALTRKVLH